MRNRCDHGGRDIIADTASLPWRYCTFARQSVQFPITYIAHPYDNIATSIHATGVDVKPSYAAAVSACAGLPCALGCDGIARCVGGRGVRRSLRGGLLARWVDHPHLGVRWA